MKIESHFGKHCALPYFCENIRAMALTYSNEIIINLPREEVVRLIEDPDNMKHWQPGFISMEHISGERGKDGMKSRLNYKMGKREVTLVETITTYGFPDEFHATYEADNVYNEQKNYFYKLDGNRTKWVSDSMFQFSGFMKIIGWLMPGSFKKQSCKYLEMFKDFAENGASAAEK